VAGEGRPRLACEARRAVDVPSHAAYGFRVLPT
jgi:hypothetical protein